MNLRFLRPTFEIVYKVEFNFKVDFFEESEEETEFSFLQNVEEFFEDFFVPFDPILNLKTLESDRAGRLFLRLLQVGSFLSFGIVLGLELLEPGPKVENVIF